MSHTHSSILQHPTRRAFLVLLGGLTAAACTPAPTSAPTAPPPAAAAKPTGAPAPATQPTPAAAATTAPVAPTTAPAAVSGAVTIPFYTTENDPQTLDFFKKSADEFKQQTK